MSTAPSALRNRRLCRRPCTWDIGRPRVHPASSSGSPALRLSGSLALWLSGPPVVQFSGPVVLPPNPSGPVLELQRQLDWTTKKDDKKNTGRPSPRTYSRYPRVRTNTMGFWLGTVFFAALEVLGMFLVKSLIGTRQGRRHELLGQLLVATSVICCWLLWVIVYMGQMKVCLRYGCLSPAGNPASLRPLPQSTHHLDVILTISPDATTLKITDSRSSIPSCRRNRSSNPRTFTSLCCKNHPFSSSKNIKERNESIRPPSTWQASSASPRPPGGRRGWWRTGTGSP